ncbi:MAG: hypothetical protein ABI220_01800 [Candidatus Saccharimonadales bacterium]
MEPEKTDGQNDSNESIVSPPSESPTPVELETPSSDQTVAIDSPATSESSPESTEVSPTAQVETPVAPAPQPESTETSQSDETDKPILAVSPSESAAVPVTSAGDSVSASSPTTITSPPDDGSNVIPIPASGANGNSSKKKWLLPLIIAIVVLIVLAGGYVFAFYVPNTPANVYKSGLENSGAAADKLVDYLQQQNLTDQKSVAFDGSLKVKATGASFDTTLSGAFDKEANGDLKLDADVMGQQVSANIISVKDKGNTSPDVYLKVSGVKTYLDQAGLGSLSDLDGKWISVDHTLIDSYADYFKQSLGSSSDVLNNTKMPTTAQINDALSKVEVVNRQYIFTADSSKAILKQDKFIGKETKDGRSVYHYQVSYDKDHLQAYVSAVKAALDSSQLNDWSKKANDGKTLSQVVDFGSITDGIKNAKDGYSFDLWIDKGTKLISSLQFTDSSDKSKLIIGQNYTGGDDYPLTLAVSDPDGSGGSLNFTVNTKTNKYSLDFSANDKAGKDSTTVSGKFSLTPGSDLVKETAPTGAESINKVLEGLGLGTASAGSDETIPNLFSL